MDQTDRQWWEPGPMNKWFMSGWRQPVVIFFFFIITVANFFLIGSMVINIFLLVVLAGLCLTYRLKHRRSPAT